MTRNGTTTPITRIEDTIILIRIDHTAQVTQAIPHHNSREMCDLTATRVRTQFQPEVMLLYHRQVRNHILGLLAVPIRIGRQGITKRVVAVHSLRVIDHYRPQQHQVA